MKFLMRFACVALCLSAAMTHAASLGVVGETFPVAEMSFLHFIEFRLNELAQSGEIDEISEHFIETVSAHANRPVSVGLPRAAITKTHFYTPVVWVNEDILDAQGLVIVAKSTRINALEKLPQYTPTWVFVDGDDKAQVLWAKRQLRNYPEAKLILTGGAVGDMENVLAHEIFFDQMGRISNQLGINQVPALVSRSNNQLLIKEIAIKEDGYAR